MQGFGSRRRVAGFSLALVLVLAGCAAPRSPAPLEDRGTMSRAPSGTEADPNKPPLPGIENLGKPGYYAVRPGDTIRRIGLETGQNWRDIARWNSLQNPDLIEVGQVLRVVPPSASMPAAVTPAPAAVVDSSGVVTRPVTQSSLGSGAAATPSTAPAGAAKPPSPASDEDLGWIWPAQGTQIAGFDEAKNKGVDIAGKAGDPVVAAADGRVVYAGAGLRGYGNLIILKHNGTYLTAYAHNQTLLVKEDQTVQKGQKIAEMGNSDANRVKLHFEIRRQGKPVDPSRYLPAR
ncbi:MAG: peptidoglycan DD-metalloendopeptidase family protein [Variovorax sp.]